MKRKVVNAVIGGLFLAAFLFVSHSTFRYTRTAEVKTVNNNLVTVVDTTGNRWCFEGEGYKEGQTVTLKMFTNNTDNVIEDDIIEKVSIINN